MRRIPKVNVDYKYNHNKTVARFVNIMMMDGKKMLSLRVLYKALERLRNKVEGKTELELFERAVDQVKPQIEVKSRRVGGATYQVPTEVTAERQQALAMRWLIKAARTRSSGKTMDEKLSLELLDAYNATGVAYKKKEEAHRMAEANKAFAHYKF